VIEAKKTGTTLSGVAGQSAGYAAALPDFLANLVPGTKSLPFAYESTGVETFFRDERDPDTRSRRVFSFHRPETLAGWLQGGSGVPPLGLEKKRHDAASTLLASLSPSDQAEYHRRFSATIEDWLDQGTGSCVPEIPECRAIVENALRHFDGQRYMPGEHIVAANHVHVLVTPLPGHALAEILHSWKSFTAKEIIKVEAAPRRLSPWWNTLNTRRQNSAARSPDGAYPVAPIFRRPVWQKESFDHIVRSPASLHKFVAYIRNHQNRNQSGSDIPSLDSENQKRRDAASTLLITAACAPFDNPAFRVALVHFALEQQPVLKPFAESVTERFTEWLMDKAQAGTTFSPDQLAWLNFMRDHIATSVTVEPDDFVYAPFFQRGGLGRAHQLFGSQLPALLDELNTALAA
jgi:REP element-mobilizing transposase RayT